MEAEKFLNMENGARTEEEEFLSGFGDFLVKQKEIDDKKKFDNHEALMERYKDLTEYQFLFTHYAIENSSDRESMEKLWRSAEAAAEKMNLKEYADRLK